MAFIMIIINVIGVVLNYGKTDASGWAVASLIASIFAFGIFSNFRNDPMSAPSYAVLVSTASGLAGLVMIVVGIAA